MRRAREIILGADDRVTESIEWQTPTFAYRGNIASFNPSKHLLSIMFHRGWYRWVTLAMLAYAFLVVAAVTEHAQRPAPPGAVELTCNGIQHLFATLVATPVADRGHRLRWSWWRRRRQARARAGHYRRQAAQQP